MGASLMTPAAFAAFQEFVRARHADFRRIAAATQGEYSAQDVSQQALVTAYDLQADKGIAMRFDDAAYRKLLLSHLYQHFVRYTDTVVRRALRYRRKRDDDPPFDLLTETLPAGDQYDPSHGRDGAEAAWSTEDPDAQMSQASAYLFLFACCNNEVGRLAAHLLISRSHCYRCLAQARASARWQEPLAVRCIDHRGTPLKPKGWRRLRYERRPMQLQFDFVTAPTLWQAGPVAAE